MQRRYSSPAGPRDDTRWTPRPPLPRFHTTLPDSPAPHRHSVVSLPPPSRSSPESPANATDALKDILQRHPHPRPRSRSEGVTVTKEASCPRISQPQPQLQPQNISVAQTTHQPKHDTTPPKKPTLLRSLFPLSTITTAVPTTPFPTPTTPPFTSPLSHHERPDENAKEEEKREKFDVDKVYERLRVAEGRVSFDDLGLGLCAEDIDREGDAREDGRG
ncbi:hypothetical protein I306_02906 [Cryptococcus gattii EJB2]|uniref:Uncharacterized protein n=1 Tax=Cryptococcus gattii EJB2 TaxID=1296103 RepID=A0ABR5BX39_9TREE|nr:hypothetical protein I306_02906 [Cryptococcus gattii EJB2]